jgi:hypothetical protein
MAIRCLKYGIVEIKEYFLHLFVLFLCTKDVIFPCVIHMSTISSYSYYFHCVVHVVCMSRICYVLCISECVFIVFYCAYIFVKPVTVWTWTVCARSDAGIVGSNPTQGMDVWCMYAFILCCVFVCSGSGLATDWSLIQGALPSVKNDYGTE